MKLSRIGARVAVGIAVLAAANTAPNRAAAQDSTYMRQVADTGDAGDRIDANAIAALQKMGAYLRTLKSFGVHAVVTTEDVMEDGEKVQRSNVTDLVTVRPTSCGSRSPTSVSRVPSTTTARRSRCGHRA